MDSISECHVLVRRYLSISLLINHDLFFSSVPLCFYSYYAQYQLQLNYLCRNLNYWDTVSTLAGEVENPAKTFPKALGMAVTLVVLAYLLPLLVGIGVASDTGDWTLGYFAGVAKQVRNPIQLFSIRHRISYS